MVVPMYTLYTYAYALYLNKFAADNKWGFQWVFYLPLELRS